MSGSAAFQRVGKSEKGNLFLTQKIEVGVTAGARINDCRKVLGKRIGATAAVFQRKTKRDPQCDLRRPDRLTVQAKAMYRLRASRVDG